MKRMLFRGMILLTTLLSIAFTPNWVQAAGNNWIDGRLRIDLPAIYNAQDYSLFVRAGQLPTVSSNSFTTPYLALNIRSDLNQTGFFQVGLLAENDGLHWFVEMFDVTNGGVTCLLGAVNWTISGIASGCKGPVGQIVELNQWHRVELVKYASNNYWIARVYDKNSISYDVAKIFINASRIYQAFADFEEAYVEATDPFIQAQTWLANPQYVDGQWKDWPLSSRAIGQHNHIQSIPQTICPNYYGATPNYGTSYVWTWFAGSGGAKCSWLFPPVTVDNSNSLALSYTGSWSHGTNWPRAYNQTVSWTNGLNNKVTLTNWPASYSITRLYTMHPNRGNQITTVNGVASPSTSDSASPARWQVAKTWPVTGGSASIEVKNNGGGYTDADAFVIDIPRMLSGTFDDRHYRFNYIGSWTNSIGFAAAYNSTSSYTRNIEDAVTFTFEGSQITYYYTKAFNRGKAVITIDGVAKPDIDLCTPYPTVLWQQSTSYSGLGAGTHTIHIANGGATGCSDSYIDVDKVEVQYP